MSCRPLSVSRKRAKDKKSFCQLEIKFISQATAEQVDGAARGQEEKRLLLYTSLPVILIMRMQYKKLIWRTRCLQSSIAGKGKAAAATAARTHQRQSIIEVVGKLTSR